MLVSAVWFWGRIYFVCCFFSFLILAFKSFIILLTLYCNKGLHFLTQLLRLGFLICHLKALK